MHIDRGVDLCYAVFVTKLSCYGYSTIDTSLKNNIIQRNVVVALAICSKLSVIYKILNQICLDLTFFILRCLGVTFSRHSVAPL